MAISTDRTFGSKLAWIATFIAIWGAGGFAIDLALGAAGVDVMPAWILVSWTFLALGFTKGLHGPFGGAPDLADAPAPRPPHRLLRPEHRRTGIPTQVASTSIATGTDSDGPCTSPLAVSRPASLSLRPSPALQRRVSFPVPYLPECDAGRLALRASAHPRVQRA